MPSNCANSITFVKDTTHAEYISLEKQPKSSKSKIIEQKK